MAVTGPAVVAVADPSQVGQARRAGAAVARAAGLDETEVARVALVVTESATNLLRHGGGGHILVQAAAGIERSVEILALDRGPGMASVAACLADGYSTAGTSGSGLGAIRRASETFDVYTRRGAGTAVFSRVGRGATARLALSVGGVAVPKAGEEVCGDAWEAEWSARGVTIVVLDGLGHGILASEAAEAGVAAFRRARDTRPRVRVEAIHAALRSTRGAAVGVAAIDLGTRTVSFAGLGNIAAVAVGAGVIRRLVSQNGTAGQAARRIDEFQYPWPDRGMLVMHSDGLGTPRDLDVFPGLGERHPVLVAGVLYRELARGHDDVSVVVAREMSS
jgi:anti-sigma regulatory factor (Ser/Thr protein kinase)